MKITAVANEKPIPWESKKPEYLLKFSWFIYIGLMIFALGILIVVEQMTGHISERWAGMAMIAIGALLASYRLTRN